MSIPMQSPTPVYRGWGHEISGFEKRPADSVLRWSLEALHPRIALACSLQAEDMVVLDMAWAIRPDVRVFTLDTGRLHEETYEMMERIHERYGIRIRTFFPRRQDVERLERDGGLYSFRRSVAERRICCGIRKVEPLRRALRGLGGWITGLRRDQNTTRDRIGKVERDDRNGGILKVNPIADWSSDRVWSYIRSRGVPYHPLHDHGYSSIGCAPCTRAVGPGEDPRAGRWWWERPGTKECGLHGGDR